MSDVAIRLEGLSKQYRIGGKREPYKTLRDTLSEAFLAPFRRVGALWRGQTPRAALSDNTIWALKDISCEIKRGEAVGIIGRNGAGKSTLLKILSRIVEPTEGYAEIHGRVGSLLEVGSGFHPELTGRENVYLNGAILGMKRAEIEQKFEEIVAFAEVEKFIDTPVKYYSTGMHMRLAFAVAAHLEPEVLIVDEVLAVGDVQFQRKCLGKMQDVSKNQGRTVLFVSHHMDAIQRLCSKCLMLDRGQLIAQGSTASIVEQYLSKNVCRAQPNEWVELSNVSRIGTGEAHFVAVQYSSLNREIAFQPHTNGPLEFLLAIESDSAKSVGSVAVTLYDLSGTKLVNVDTVSLGQCINIHKGRNLVRLRIESLYLNPGVYRVGLWLANPIGAQFSTRTGVYDFIESAFEIGVVDVTAQGLGMRPDNDGVVACHLKLLEVT